MRPYATGREGRPGETPPGARTPPRRRPFDELDVTRCRQLLAEHQVGRIAWSAADGPQLFPVSYAWIDGCVVFRTSPYGILSELVRRTAVVFEVDQIDESRRQGWSVIVRGRAVGIASPDQVGGSAEPVIARPWAGGDRNLVIAVTPQQITGRVFHPPAPDRFG